MSGEILPCPFRGARCSTCNYSGWDVVCRGDNACSYTSGGFGEESQVVAAHNTIARAAARVAELEEENARLRAVADPTTKSEKRTA